MYDYSPIDEILIKNFRNIKEAQISFKDSPIVSLIGGNEAGKTSVIKAVTVCMKHKFAREQKKYIRLGTKGFGVAIKLADYTSIVRVKTDTINRYEIQYPNKESWSTNTIDGNDVPEKVQELMGIVEEPETKELLQIRTYEDQLLFATTPASSNYKVMYNALKVEELNNALSLGNAEINKRNSEINRDDIKIQALTESMRNIQIVDIEPLVNIRESIKENKKILDIIEQGLSLLEKIETITKKLEFIDELNKNNIDLIDEYEVTKLDDALRLLGKINKLDSEIANYDSIKDEEEIELELAEKLNQAVDYLKIKENLASKGLDNLEIINEQDLIDYEEAQLIDKALQVLERVNKLDKRIEIQSQVYECEELTQNYFDVINLVLKANKCVVKINQLNESIQSNQNDIARIEKYMIDKGVDVVSCSKCGESMIIDVNSIVEKYNRNIAN